MYVCMYVCVHACMHAWMDGWMYVCMFIYMYTHVCYVCIHTCSFIYIVRTHSASCACLVAVASLRFQNMSTAEPDVLSRLGMV